MGPHSPRIVFVLITLYCGCATEPPPIDIDDVPVAERKRVFQHRNGTLGKIRDSTDTRPAVDVADEDCTRGADGMGLGGMWKAWLSSSEADAIDRVGDVGPWYRIDRATLLFATKAELADGPRERIDPGDAVEDEDACMRFGSCAQTFLTGTIEGRRTNDTCYDWTVYNVPAIGTVGRADRAGGDWVVATPLACSAYLALLCIEQ